MKKLSDIILKETQYSAFCLQTGKRLYSGSAKRKMNRQFSIRQSMEIQFRKSADRQWKKEKLVKYEAQTGEKKWIHTAQDYSISSVPFRVKNQSVGSLTVWMKRQWMDRQSEIELLQHLMTLGSSQLAVLELEQQKNLLAQAEFKALQFQVNPHFFI